MKKKTIAAVCLLACAALTACTDSGSSTPESSTRPETTSSAPETTTSAAETTTTTAVTTTTTTAAPAAPLTLEGAVGTWYQNGDLRDDRWIISPDGSFLIFYADDTGMMGGTVKIESAGSAEQYCFYDEMGTLHYSYAPAADEPETKLTGTLGDLRREDAIVADAAAMKPYYAYLAGTYTRSKFGDEKIVIGTDGSYVCTLAGETTTGTVAFISVQNQDGSHSLQCKLTDIGGNDRLIFPVMDIRRAEKGLLDMDYEQE